MSFLFLRPKFTKEKREKEWLGPENRLVPLSTPSFLRRDPERSGKVKEPTSLSSLTEPLAGS